MLKFIYSKCMTVLREKPVKLWALSLLGTLLVSLASVLGVLPIISIPLSLTISAGLSIIFLKGYDREDFVTENIFDGFKNFKHVACGMCWMALWLFLWALIPIAGIVMVIIKSYEYRFTPYILMTEPEIAPTQALKESMKRTEGHKGHMFLAELVPMLIIYAVMFILGLLSTIRGAGILFGILMMIFNLAVCAFAPIFFGLLSAAFFREVPNMPIKPVYTAPTYPQGGFNNTGAANAGNNTQQNVYGMPGENTAANTAAGVVCPNCGAQNLDGAKFCAKCGTKL